VLNKLRTFVLRGPVRAIVGQERSTIDAARTVDKGGLLLAVRLVSRWALSQTRRRAARGRDLSGKHGVPASGRA
jgi:hypothetical protein